MIPPTERQARVIWFAATGLAIGVLVGLAAALVWGLGRVLHVLAPVLWPLAVAGVFAYLLDPVVDFLHRKGVPRARAIITVFVFAFVLVSALLGSIVPQLVIETRELAAKVPEYADSVERWAHKWINNPPPWLRKLIERDTPQSGTNAVTFVTTTDETVAVTTTNLPPATAATTQTNQFPLLAKLLDKQTLQTAAGGLAGAVKSGGSWLAGRVVSWFGILAGLALIPVYAFYFLLEKQRISSRWTDYLPVSDSRFKQELVFILTSINNYLIAFFRGQVLVAICDGILYGIGFLIIGLPYAVLIGAAAMVLTMIPFLGAIVICGTSLIIAAVQFGDWKHPLLVLAVFGVVQTLEGLVISPKIMGDKVGLHPLTIIIAVMAGTTLLGGLLGGILAIPLTAALRVIMFRYVWRSREAINS